ncbi:hypothetical protein ACSGMT_003003 [Escherichia coli]
MEHHAFARVDGERGAVEDGQAHAVLLVQDEGFTDVLYVNHFSPRGSGVGCDADASYPTYGERICRPDKAFTLHPAPAQFCKTDDTSSCVYG